jgi:inward rectifier potassium channel
MTAGAGPGTKRPRDAPRAKKRSRDSRRLTLTDRTIVTHGLRDEILHDLYHQFMKVSWPFLFGVFASYFLSFNLIFASLYALEPGCIANLNPPDFWGYFFFSVETLATVGYGDMHPQTVYSHVVSSIEIFVGLLTIALMTGGMFARFSRPRARVLFSAHGVVRPLEGKSTLMFRAANARQNIIMEATAQLRMLVDVVTAEGIHFRRIVDLPLVRSSTPIFLLGWNLMHVIDETSPLLGENAQSLAASRALFLLTMSGTDETTGQVVMARHEYTHDSIRWNHSFRDVLHTDGEGVEHLDYTRFDLVDPLPDPDLAEGSATE